MPVDELNETLVFEVPSQARAVSLCGRLRPRWHCDSYDCGDMVLVAAELRPQSDDFAILLRAVKLWALDSEVPFLRFHVDGRAYVLDAGAGQLQPAA